MHSQKISSIREDKQPCFHHHIDDSNPLNVEINLSLQSNDFTSKATQSPIRTAAYLLLLSSVGLGLGGLLSVTVGGGGSSLGGLAVGGGCSLLLGLLYRGSGLLDGAEKEQFIRCGLKCM